MKKAFLILAVFVALFSFSSCDQDEYYETFETSTVEKDDIEVDGEEEDTDPDDTGI